MQHLFSLEGKKILITGASGGIGESVALTSGLQGAELTISARNQERLNEVLKDLLTDSVRHTTIPCDLSSAADLDALVESLEPLDGVVLNAGAVKLAPIAFINDATVDELFEINVQSSIRLMQRLIRKKKIKKGASLVFISSISTQKATIGNAVYNATKGAVNAFVKSLALELAAKQIRVNAIMPGFVPTGILKTSGISKEELDAHQKNYPLGRYGKPEDVAYLCVYLLSDQASWMTGALLNLDGGFSLK
ncbi:SDR family NAD(P)-dependent oxidoreductase [Gelidibacter mesophilus]|uniref:SDR family NAD(P)-dependent oxidoreductase n=1 Tax=Gelidibacter mesophilus TaxID=169050 RepID=UPI000424A115|nr:SDR family oxidoreductase [Gelidibacter mesophilus]